MYNAADRARKRKSEDHRFSIVEVTEDFDKSSFSGSVGQSQRVKRIIGGGRLEAANRHNSVQKIFCKGVSS